MKVVAVLVTYNPDQSELIKNLTALEKEVEKILICNNSPESLAEKIKISKQLMKKIKIIDFFKNKGIAEAQSVGMKKAFEEEAADFVLQMDQDSIIQSGMVDKLKKAYLDLQESGYKIGLVGPQDFDKDSMKASKARFRRDSLIEVKKKQYLDVVDTLSSGSLIPKEAYLEVGEMLNKLFIDAVDFEYCWRLKAYDFKIIKVSDAYLAHKLGEGHKKFLGVEYGIPSPIRHYYQFRNTLYMMKFDYVPLDWKIKSLIKLLIKVLIYPFLLGNGILRLKFMLEGIKDFYKKNMGEYQKNFPDSF